MHNVKQVQIAFKRLDKKEKVLRIPVEQRNGQRKSASNTTSFNQTNKPLLLDVRLLVLDGHESRGLLGGHAVLANIDPSIAAREMDEPGNKSKISTASRSGVKQVWQYF